MYSCSIPAAAYSYPPPIHAIGFPFIALASFILVSLVSKASGKGANFYAKAGGVANEVISSIRTIASLTAEENELKRYSAYLESAERSGVKAGERSQGT